MTKSELIARINELNPHLYQSDAERIVSTVFDEIAQALAQGSRVELRGFGVFSTRRRRARPGRNPRTGETIRLPETKTPCFKAGKVFKDAVK